MKILVTGGAGFIGSHTVDALVASGNHQVSIIDNLSAGKRHQVNPAARFHEVDIRDADAVRNAIAIETPEVIVHLAAQMDVRRSVADPAFDAQVNIVGFLNLMEAGRQHGLRRVIFSSTGGAIYGEQEEFPAPEDHPLHPVSPYGVAKMATEAYLFFYKVQYGIDYTALRYGNVYGPRQDPHGEAGVVAIFCGRMLEGKPCTIYGDGKQTRSFCYVSDLIEGILRLLDSQERLPVNIGNPQEITILEFAERVRELTGNRVQIVFRPLPQDDPKRRCPDIAKARKLLGWEPKVQLQEGLKLTLAYFEKRMAEERAKSGSQRGN